MLVSAAHKQRSLNAMLIPPCPETQRNEGGFFPLPFDSQTQEISPFPRQFLPLAPAKTQLGSFKQAALQDATPKFLAAYMHFCIADS